MKVIIGLVVASYGLWASSKHLNQNILQYWDIVAFFMVVLGTFAVSIITLPPFKMTLIIKEILSSLKFTTNKRLETLKNCAEVLSYNYPTGKSGSFDKIVLKDGIELAKLGFSSNKLERILNERVACYTNDCLSISSWLTSLSKYPPAFGLAGTILGLTNLMKSLSQGADPKEIGVSMAIALVATLYGVLLSNLIISPLGERIKSNALENEVLCEISIKTIIMLKDKTNLLEAQEYLNGYLANSNKKHNFLTSNFLEAS